MSKSVKSVVIAAAALLILGAAVLILMLTKPSEENPEDSGASIAESTAENENPYIIDRKADEVTKLSVTNETGSFTFIRQKRVVSETDESGSVVSHDEYYWTSEELLGVPQNDALVNSFVSSFAALPQESLVEENAEDLEKYGLKNPKSTAELNFEDGTVFKMFFGIRNPANESSVYFKGSDNTVRLVNYGAAQYALGDIKNYAKLTLTEGYNSDGSNELSYMKISRPDLDSPVELRYMSELAELSENEDNVISTFNTHKFISPVTAEIDVTKGKEVCYGVYSLVASSCEYLERSDENLKACGLDEPAATVEFKFGGKEHKLLIGNALREELASAADGTITTVKGYYAVLDDLKGIYLLSADSVPWLSCTVEDLISRRPLSPYIYSCDSVEVTLPEGKYIFEIDGTAKSFKCGGKTVDDSGFKALYQTLIGSVGEEMYSSEEQGALAAEVKFNYNDEYQSIYGAESDTLSYYESDGRKCVVALNGTPIFKVRAVYTDRLVENVKALLSGGEVKTDW